MVAYGKFALDSSSTNIRSIVLKFEGVEGGITREDALVDPANLRHFDSIAEVSQLNTI
jgi:hypothetical protein